MMLSLTLSIEPRQILVCTLKMSFLLCKSKFERNNKVVCVSREDVDQYRHIFHTPLHCV